jgi:predicted glycosyltransferase
VPFFSPLIREFESRGHSVSVTIRDYGYTTELASQAGMTYTCVGSHPGGNILRKLVSLGSRSLRLAAWATRRKFDLALSHGSRGLVGAAWLAGIPTVTMFDYEHVSSGLFHKLSSRLLLPEALDRSVIGDRVRYYPGYKEEVYLGDFKPRTGLSEIPVPAGRVIVLIRPPATTAHYHDSRSEDIFRALLQRISASDSAFGIIAPRTAQQGCEIRNILENPLNFHILERSMNGLDLIWNADLIVGGGGTMNREAALLGVPVYSIFTGPIGAIDRRLSEEGRLQLIRKTEDVTEIKVESRDRDDVEALMIDFRERSKVLVSGIVDSALEVARMGRVNRT